MSYALLSQNGRAAHGVQEWVVDEEKDLDLIPRNTIQLGDSAFVVATGEVYMANSEGKWVKI